MSPPIYLSIYLSIYLLGRYLLSKVSYLYCGGPPSFIPKEVAIRNLSFFLCLFLGAVFAQKSRKKLKTGIEWK